MLLLKRGVSYTYVANLYCSVVFLPRNLLVSYTRGSLTNKKMQSGFVEGGTFYSSARFFY